MKETMKIWWIKLKSLILGCVLIVQMKCLNITKLMANKRDFQ